MTDEDMAWSKERVREKLLAEKLGTPGLWDGEDITRMTRLWTQENAFGVKVIRAEYYKLCDQMRKELFNE